jgi:DNA-binding transcriptional MerR regulator
MTTSNQLESLGLDPNTPFFPISVVANELKVHQRTLRIYDEANLLVPKRSAKGRRLYSLNDLCRGKIVKYLVNNLNVGLNGIKVILELTKNHYINPNFEYYTQLSKKSGLQNISNELLQSTKGSKKVK